MNAAEKDKLRHDFLNSMVIINGMTKSASSFLNIIAKSIDGNNVSQKQMEKFLYSMNTIREQTAKIENYFQCLLDEL